MPWSGGTYTFPTNMSANDAAGLKIESSTFSSAHDDLELGIDSALHKAGQNSPTADLPMAGNRHSNVGAAQSTNQYQRVNETITQFPVFLLDKNTLSSISISCSASGIGQWPNNAAGNRVHVQMARNYPSTSAKPIFLKVASATSDNVVGPRGQTLWPGALVSGHTHTFVHDGSNWRVKDPLPSIRTFTLTKGAMNLGSIEVTLLPSVAGSAVVASQSVQCWTDGTRAQVGISDRMDFLGTTTTDTLYLSGLPSYMRPSVTQGGAVIHIANDASAADAGVSHVKVSTNGRIMAQRGFPLVANPGKWGTATMIRVQPFSMTYLVTTST